MISVLFARRDSIYKTFQNLDVWDIDRNALNWKGGNPVIAHPPCRAWGAFSHFAKPREGEKDLAPWAIQQVRKYGGVLEHPANSKLWSACNINKIGIIDKYGGLALGIHQHKIPIIPMRLDYPTHVIGDVGRAGKDKRPEVSKAEREQTPKDLAVWLIDLAEKCNLEY